jgi:RND family efflux transporter MFP subunit
MNRYCKKISATPLLKKGRTLFSLFHKGRGREIFPDSLFPVGKGLELIFVGSVILLLTLFLGSLCANAESIEFDGLIEPKMLVKVGSGVPGILDTVKVDRGDMVREGQVLATLQSDVERATMELARARADLEATIKAKQEELEFARRNRERIKDLYETKALPFHEWDQVETKRILAELGLAEALESRRLAEFEYKRAAEVVKRMTIQSPVTGVVVERFLHPGEYIEDQPILELAKIDPLHVEVILPVEMLGSVKVGMRATVKPEAPVSGFYDATVTIVDKVVDAASGTFGVRLHLPNPNYKLPPGLKCKVVFLELEKQVSKSQESGLQLGSYVTRSLKERPQETDQVKKRAASAGGIPTGQVGKQYHEVQSGESLYLIAMKYGLSVDELCRLNNINPRQIIRPGQKLLFTLEKQQ